MGRGMEVTITDKFLQAVNQGNEYIPIQVSSLRVDTTTNFDLYFKASPGEQEVLYANRETPFDNSSMRRLIENNIHFLYIHIDQIGPYRRYLEENMAQILADVGIPMEEKTQLLHLTARGVVKDVFESDEMQEGVERGAAIVANTVDFLFDQRNSLRHLIQSASFNYEVYTHSVNVCVMGLALAQRMGYSSDKLIEFGQGAMFRDIGMKNVDSSILDKAGSLSVSEFVKVQRHPIDSEAMLKELNVDSEIALSIARHHHEKMDGSGYPDGLVGEDIPILVRLCTVVDIFDALTTHRKHKKAMSSFEALTVMGKDMRDDLDMDILRGMITMLGFAEK